MYGDCEEEHCIAYDGASWLLLRSRFKSLLYSTLKEDQEVLTSLRRCKVFRQSLFPIYKSAKFGYLLDCTCVQHLCALVSEIASSIPVIGMNCIH